MKEIHSILAVSALALTSAASAQGIRATVDGNAVAFADAQPMMMSGRVMVPVRGVFEHVGASVIWDPNAHTVTAHHAADTIRLPINSRYATINDRQVALDVPASIQQGRTMVPLRFLSEAMGAGVEWVSATRTVEIKSIASSTTPPVSYTMMHANSGTVMPLTLNNKLSSNGSDAGDRFTMTLDTSGASSYQGLPSGTVFEGHVDVARAKHGDTPGVLGLAFDRVRLPDGQNYEVHGSTIGLDSKSVTERKGRLVATKSGSKTNNLKYVGYGAGAGALVAILTKGNLLTDTLIGGALGYLFGQIQRDPSKSNDVTLESGSRSGLRLTQDLAFKSTSMR